MNRNKFAFVKLKRSVLKNVKPSEQENVIQAGIGDDYGRLLFPYGAKASEISEDIAVSTGLCISNSFGYVKTDMLKLYNNLKAGGYTPFAITDVIMMPSEDEKTMKTIVREISEITQELGLNIVTGHTEISDAFTNPAVTITMLGRREKIQSICSLCNIKTGMDIVMCGHAAIMGTVINVERHYSELTKRYSQDYLRTAQRMAGLMKLDKQPDIALSSGAVYTHDISSGGVYAALWELAEKAGSGIEINHDAIPIMQETIEICEFIGENPYMLDGSGAMLCVIENGNSLVEELYKQGYEAAVIGHITGGNDRIVKHDDEKRFLTPPVYSRAKGDG